MRDISPLTNEFLTYNTKRDPANSDQRFMVAGSKNVLIVDQNKVKSREGYTLQSPAGTVGAITASTEWDDSTNDHHVLRAYDTYLEAFINGSWETLMSGLTSVALIFAPYWDNTEKIDRLLWCDGTTNLYDWSGAVAALDSITAATVSCRGGTFGSQRFLTTGTRSLRIKDDLGVWHEVDYTGGEGTNTLTGLSVDLTAFPFGGGNLIVQKVVTRANQPSSSFKTDFLIVAGNQAWLGSRSSNQVYVSKNSSITDYTFSTPRALGEGAILTLDAPGRAIGVLKGDIIIYAGMSLIYKSKFNQITVGSSLAETLSVERLKTTALQSCQHHNLLEALENGLAWVGYDNVLYFMSDASLSYNPVVESLSDPIKPDFDATDFTGGHLKFFRNRLYLSAPASTTNFIREYRTSETYQVIWFWQPPQTLPINRWAIINSNIAGHSSATNETYTLFSGYNDNGKAIHSVLKLAQWYGGDKVRNLLKHCDELFNEGYISPNTSVDVSYVFEEDGGDYTPFTKTIANEENTLYVNIQDPSLGNGPAGDESLAGDVSDENTIPHFRIIHEVNPKDFFGYTASFETNDIDYRWSLFCHGSNSELSDQISTAIKSSN